MMLISVLWHETITDICRNIIIKCLVLMNTAVSSLGIFCSKLTIIQPIYFKPL